jgi:hypothetical protein
MLGRFIQPDTITPGGPQGLNRFSYTLNNPLRYTDPSGHKACTIIDNGDCDDTEEKIYKFFNYVDDQILNGKKDGIKGKYKNDVLGAMIKVVKQAAYIFGNDWDTFLDATTYAFTGYYGHGSEAMWKAHKSDFTGYFDGDSGFHSNFVDDSNQVRHFWAAFATAANPNGDNPFGAMVATAGNGFHEISQDTINGDDHATVIDYKLSVTGIDIAKQVGQSIKAPSDLVPVLGSRLGSLGTGYIGPYVDPLNWFTPWD